MSQTHSHWAWMKCRHFPVSSGYQRCHNNGAAILSTLSRHFLKRNFLEHQPMGIGHALNLSNAEEHQAKKQHIPFIFLSLWYDTGGVWATTEPPTFQTRSRHSNVTPPSLDKLIEWGFASYFPWSSQIECNASLKHLYNLMTWWNYLFLFYLFFQFNSVLLQNIARRKSKDEKSHCYNLNWEMVYRFQEYNNYKLRCYKIN